MRDLRYAGVGCGAHATYEYLCVMDYSQTVDGYPVMPARLARNDVRREDSYPF
jgi:hypothetical protein